VRSVSQGDFRVMGAWNEVPRAQAPADDVDRPGPSPLRAPPVELRLVLPTATWGPAHAPARPSPKVPRASGTWPWAARSGAIAGRVGYPLRARFAWGELPPLPRLLVEGNGDHDPSTESPPASTGGRSPAAPRSEPPAPEPEAQPSPPPPEAPCTPAVPSGRTAPAPWRPTPRVLRVRFAWAELPPKAGGTTGESQRGVRAERFAMPSVPGPSGGPAAVGPPAPDEAALPTPVALAPAGPPTLEEAEPARAQVPVFAWEPAPATTVVPVVTVPPEESHEPSLEPVPTPTPAEPIPLGPGRAPAPEILPSAPAETTPSGPASGEPTTDPRRTLVALLARMWLVKTSPATAGGITLAPPPPTGEQTSPAGAPAVPGSAPAPPPAAPASPAAPLVTPAPTVPLPAPALPVETTPYERTPARLPDVDDRRPLSGVATFLVEVADLTHPPPRLQAPPAPVGAAIPGAREHVVVRLIHCHAHVPARPVSRDACRRPRLVR
jgi:hypothetical protein